MVIDGWVIKQDAEGRYCLNDVHKAAIEAGENARTHEPKEFLRRPETNELVGELITGNSRNKNFNPVVAKAGRYGGTYAVKELVYAYAMWISAEYHLKVIRAYDRMVVDTDRSTSL